MNSLTALSPDVRPFRVLVAGYINVNVIDGSAFFLTGLSSMLAQLPSVEVTLVTANPVRHTEVLDEVLHLPNVQVIDPFADSRFDQISQPPYGDWMTRRQYAECLALVDERGGFDSVVIRDNETAVEFLRCRPEAGDRTAAYVTGITSIGSQVSSETAAQLHGLLDSPVKFLCQTPSMAGMIETIFGDEISGRLQVLPPHVPDSDGTFEDLYHFSDRPNRLVYTGKFFRNWNPDKLLAAVKAARIDGSLVSLQVAGDQFKRDGDSAYFAESVKYLLENTDGVKWHGRVPRLKSRKIIESSHVGVGWRAQELDGSAELSTKLLEYGAMARPSIVNRTAMHEDLLGSDYPLFANTMSEFRNLISRLEDSPEVVEYAARRCYEVAQSYTYSSVRPALLAFLGNRANERAETISIRIDQVAERVPEGLDLRAMYALVIRGMWADLVPHAGGADARVLYQQAGTWISMQAEAQKVVRKLVQTSIAHNGLSFSTQSQEQLSLDRFKSDVSKYERKIVELKRNHQLEVQNLQSKIDTRDRKIEELTERLNALRHSKLGKIQRAIWRVRS